MSQNLKIKVTIIYEHSEPGYMKYEVPQGPILGPVPPVTYTLILQNMLAHYASLTITIRR